MSEQQPPMETSADNNGARDVPTADTDDMQAAADANAENGDAAAPSRPRRRWRPLRLLLSLVLQLLILILLLLGFVLGTQTGLRAAIAVAEDLAPGMLQVGSVEGRILGELRLQGLKLDLPSLKLDLGHLHLDWSPGSLFGGTLRISDLSASDIDIVVEPGPEKEPSPSSCRRSSCPSASISSACWSSGSVSARPAPRRRRRSDSNAPSYPRRRWAIPWISAASMPRWRNQR